MPQAFRTKGSRSFAREEIEVLNMTRTSISSVSRLKGLQNLKHLVLAFTPLGDAGLESLNQFTSLQELDLRATSVTDNGLRHIGELKNLRSLSLGELPITDELMKSLARLTHLENLDLDATRITDRGMSDVRAPQRSFGHFTSSGPNR